MARCRWRRFHGRMPLTKWPPSAFRSPRHVVVAPCSAVAPESSLASYVACWDPAIQAPRILRMRALRFGCFRASHFIGRGLAGLLLSGKKRRVARCASPCSRLQQWRVSAPVTLPAWPGIRVPLLTHCLVYSALLSELSVCEDLLRGLRGEYCTTYDVSARPVASPGSSTYRVHSF